MSNVRFTALFVSSVVVVPVAGKAKAEHKAKGNSKRLRLADGTIAVRSTVAATTTRLRKRTGDAIGQSAASATTTVLRKRDGTPLV